MLVKVCKAKLHRLTVTEMNLNYEGSITIDRRLLQTVGIHRYEEVLVANINNGQRFETYVIEGEEGKGTVCLNGAAARLAQPGDIIIVLAYGYISEDELSNFSPRIVTVNERNQSVDL